jgi:hypothetical protein
MRNILILSAVAAAALAGTAHSATISIGTSINGGAIKTQSSGAAPGPVTFSGAVGSYDLDTVSAVDLTAASLDSNSINATTLGTKDTLNVFVSVSDITTVSGLVQALSGLTVNFLTPGWTVTESTFEDSSNTVFGTGTPLATNTFTSGPDTFTLLTPVSVTAPFSVTEEFVINSNGISGAGNNTIDLSGAVPEPSTWVMMALGFVALGYAAIRRGKGERAPSFTG